MSPQPVLKQTNQMYEINGSVFIQVCGEALEIEDPDGDVRLLLSLMDGQRTIEAIDQEFHARRPGGSFDVRQAISDLNDANLVIDGAQGTTLDDYHQERWKRNLGFFETYASLATSRYAPQEKIRDCRVTLLGLGGVGSHLSLDLLGLGVQDLRIVDFDKVELSNLNRQILYTDADTGQLKVELAVRRLEAYYPAAKIEGVQRRLMSVDDMYEMVADRDFVFCAVDRPKLHAIRWANEACVRAGVPFISGGVDTQRAITFMVNPGVTGCTACWRAESADDEFSRSLREQMRERHGLVSFGPDMAAFGPLVTTVTAMMVTEFVRFVTGIAEPISAGRLMEMRFDDLRLNQAESWSRRPDCRICGDARTAA